MLAFQVDDMTCGHCASTITQALKRIDADARVHIDLAAHRVNVQPAAAGAADLAGAIRDAGYNPVAVDPATSSAARPKGSCCGCC